MSRRSWVVVLGLVALFAPTACSDDVEPGGGWTGICIDVDGDGYGLQCALGDDCDDGDRSVHEGCARCARPEQGCPCAAGAAAVDCSVSPEVTSTGTLLCKEGTRYCRDGYWSGCEGISSFAAPPPTQFLGLKTQGLIAADAAVQCADMCKPDCYDIADPIKGGGDGGTGMDAGIAYTSTGSVTLKGGNSDAGRDPDQVDPQPPCDKLTDFDCDGIPDLLDPYPVDKPFESDHQTIFMTLAPGQTGSNTFDLRFYLKTADVYFLLDMTGSMSEEKAKLISSLKTGNFLDDPSTVVDESKTVECSDRDFDGKADDALKTLGVTGNIACLIRNAGFGTGLYREIPYSSTDSFGISYAGAPDLEGFEHRQDIAFDATAVESVNTSLNTFYTRGNSNWAESGGVALSAVATGGPIYMGWDRPGIPPRICPTGRFGYPCFRNDAMPIVVLITDAPLMNGPIPAQGHLGGWKPNSNSPTQPVNYEAKGLAWTTRSSDGLYYPVSGNEALASAYAIDDVSGSFRTFTGDTRPMAADMHTVNTPITCSEFPSTTAASPGFPDAAFRFKVTNASKKVTISTRGSRFKPSISVFPVTTTLRTPTANALIATADSLGTIGATSQVVIRSDTTPALFSTGELLSTSLGSTCLNGATVNLTAPDAYYTFTTTSAVSNVSFEIDASYTPILALFEGIVPSAGSRVGCMTQGRTSPFTVSLKANTTYTLVMRGQQVGRGPYKILVTGPSATMECAYNNATYGAKSNPNDDEYKTGNADLVDLSLPVGEYYVVLKGMADLESEITNQLATAARGRGWYQLTIGDRTLGQTGLTATMPQWGNGSNGISKELLDRGIRVITVASVKTASGKTGGATTQNLALQQQADLISSTTKAITGAQTTRDFDIANDGEGMGFAIVNAIAKLTNQVSMDVNVRLVPLPDTPSKPFIFKARAIDVPGDGCSPPVDTNADGIPDTHKTCSPGAVPRFEISITNPPAPNNVPPNPDLASKGGYNMRIEMIADGKYVIDQTPVYVIPQALVPQPPVFLFDAQGTYTQDIVAGCAGTDRPTWQQLAWNDTLPTGTSLVWRLCAGDTATELDACVAANKAVTVATVKQQDGCVGCAGYCASGVCHLPESPTAVEVSPAMCTALGTTNTSQCGTQGSNNDPSICVANPIKEEDKAKCGNCSLAGSCKWTANPISVEPALRSGNNGKRILRVLVQLNASPDRTKAPTVHDFKLRYVCTPGV